MTAFTTITTVTTMRKVRYLGRGHRASVVLLDHKLWSCKILLSALVGWKLVTDSETWASGSPVSAPSGLRVISVLGSYPWALAALQHLKPSWDGVTRGLAPWSQCVTYFPMRGMAWEVSGTFWAMRKRKTVWARRTLMETVHFCPPAAKEGERQSLAQGSPLGIALQRQKPPPEG